MTQARRAPLAEEHPVMSPVMLAILCVLAVAGYLATVTLLVSIFFWLNIDGMHWFCLIAPLFIVSAFDN